MKKRELLLCYERDKGLFLCSKEVQNLKGKKIKKTNSGSTFNRSRKSFYLFVSSFDWSFILTNKEDISNNFC